MNWSEVCAHPSLRDLPFKIELNEWGQIVMSPVKVRHSIFQGEIEALLRSLKPEGKVAPECAIRTRKGTKVADIVWMSQERYHIVKNEDECSIAPEICIEVISASNTQQEMLEKKDLYFEQGAEEMWFCDSQGQLQFYTPEGELKHSQRVPAFPQKIQL